MYFPDEKEERLIPSCPKCSATFTIGKGANCLDGCPAKWLENKHREVFPKIIDFCLPNRGIKTIIEWEIIPKNESWYWGWTLDGDGEIHTCWYTLRSKKNFLRFCAHEASHIIDYENQFTIEERKIIRACLQLDTKLELDFYLKEHQKIIEKWVRWNKMPHNESHKRAEWYQEYLKIHKKLLNSPWVEYAYQNFDPLLPNEHFFEKGNEKN